MRRAGGSVPHKPCRHTLALLPGPTAAASGPPVDGKSSPAPLAPPAPYILLLLVIICCSSWSLYPAPPAPTGHHLLLLLPCRSPPPAPAGRGRSAGLALTPAPGHPARSASSRPPTRGVGGRSQGGSQDVGRSQGRSQDVEEGVRKVHRRCRKESGRFTGDVGRGRQEAGHLIILWPVPHPRSRGGAIGPGGQQYMQLCSKVLDELDGLTQERGRPRPSR